MDVALRYDPALGDECTWRVSDAHDQVEARVRCASGPDVFAAFAGRYRRELAEVPDGLKITPTDAGLDVWLVESSASLHEQLPRISLVLGGCPAWVAEVLRQW